MQKKQKLQQKEPDLIEIFADCLQFSQKYKCKKKIGEGSSSNVYLVQNSNTGEELVAKAFNHIHMKGSCFH